MFHNVRVVIYMCMPYIRSIYRFVCFVSLHFIYLRIPLVYISAKGSRRREDGKETWLIHVELPFHEFHICCDFVGSISWQKFRHVSVTVIYLLQFGVNTRNHTHVRFIMLYLFHFTYIHCTCLRYEWTSLSARGWKGSFVGTRPASLSPISYLSQFCSSS